MMYWRLGICDHRDIGFNSCKLLHNYNVNFSTDVTVIITRPNCQKDTAMQVKDTAKQQIVWPDGPQENNFTKTTGHIPIILA